MSPSRLRTAARTLRDTLHRLSEQREALHAQFQHPLPPPRPPRPRVNPPVSSIAPPVSCAVPSEALSLVRHSPNDLLLDTLSHIRHFSNRAASLTTAGSSLLIIRSSLRHAYVARVARMLHATRRAARPRPVTRFASPSAVCNAAAGMALAAIVAQEQRETSAPQSLLRLLSSTAGPQKLGIGWLPAPARILLANFLACFVTGAAAYLVVLFPHAVPWLLMCGAVCFAARPDLDSFRSWTKRCAPVVAQKKTMLLDKLRAQVAPYMMALRPPSLDDYGLFSVVTVVDHADYVYVYFGVLSRWCLLGWYNIADDYNFDKIGA